MSTSIVDGVVEEAIIKRARGGLVVFDTIRFQLDDGSSRTIKKAVVKQNVADALTPGSHGRFYLYSAFDLKGVHGVRCTDGSAVYGFPSNNAKVFLILGIVNIAWVALRVSMDGQVPMLGVALLILAITGYVLMNKGHREAQRQFDGDTAYPSAAAIAARGAPATEG